MNNENLIDSIKDFITALQESGIPVLENEEIANIIYEDLGDIVENAKLVGVTESLSSYKKEVSVLARRLKKIAKARNGGPVTKDPEKWKEIRKLQKKLNSDKLRHRHGVGHARGLNIQRSKGDLSRVGRNSKKRAPGKIENKTARDWDFSTIELF